MIFNDLFDCFTETHNARLPPIIIDDNKRERSNCLVCARYYLTLNLNGHSSQCVLVNKTESHSVRRMIQVSMCAQVSSVAESAINALSLCA